MSIKLSEETAMVDFSTLSLLDLDLWETLKKKRYFNYRSFPCLQLVAQTVIQALDWTEFVDGLWIGDKYKGLKWPLGGSAL